MSKKYHLMRRNFVYDNRQLWFEKPDRLMTIYEDKYSAEETSAKYNLSSYMDAYIYQFVSTMKNQEIILEKLEKFLKSEFNLSMRLPNSSEYDVNFKLPLSMSIAQCQTIHDIVGIVWTVVEEVEPSNLFKIKDCYGYHHNPEDLFWIVANDYKTFEEARDDALYCILNTVAVPGLDSDTPWELVGSLEKLSSNVDSLKQFLNQSKHFYFVEPNWNKQGGIYTRQPVERVPRKIKYDFGEGIEEREIQDFEPSLKEECDSLVQLVHSIWYEIVQI